MPTATLSFNLPEELSDWKITHNASSYYCALWDLSQKFREMRKYDDPKKKYTAEEIESIFYEIINEKGVALDL